MGATGTTGNKLIYLTRCILVLLHTHKTPLFLVVYLYAHSRIIKVVIMSNNGYKPFYTNSTTHLC